MIDFALDNRIFITSQLDEAIQELDILFNTENTELIGYPQYGMNFEQFLWDLSPSINEVKSYISNAIQQHTLFLRNMKYEITVNVVEGKYRLIYRIGIAVNANGKTGTRYYEFK
jgi:hypothetical protein